MRPEVKHFIYSGLINPANTSDNLVYDPKLPAFGQTTGYLDANTELTSLTTKSNFIMVFRPDYCLPQNEGTGDDQIIGNKYNWKNTLIELDITPNVGLLNLMHNPFDSKAKLAYIHDGTKTLDGVHDISMNSHVDDVDLTTYANINSNGQSLVGDYAYGGIPYPQALGPVDPSESGVVMRQTEVIRSSGNVAHKGINVPTVTGTVSGRSGTYNVSVPFEGSKYTAHIVSTDDGEVWNATSQTNPGIPLYMAPSYKPYFYCRLIFFKFHFGLTDYSTFVTNQASQSNFLNSLWFDRKNNIK